jgi:hypothetical protein
MFKHKLKTLTILTKASVLGAMGLLALEGRAELPAVGSEFAIVPALPGDQVNSKIVFGDQRGFLVWEDNALDGAGQGVAAVQLNGNGDVAFEPFLVHEHSNGNQERPDVATMGDQGAIFTWESEGDVYARVQNAQGVFTGDEFQVNSFTDGSQENASVEGLANGNAVVVWESDDQDGSRKGVFGHVVGSDGNKVGEEFPVNQNSLQNQRDPEVIATEDGSFIVAWVSESPINASGDMAVTIWGRKFAYDGSPLGDEVQLTPTALLASRPSMAEDDEGNLGMVFSGMPNPALSEVSLAADRPNWSVYSSIIGDMSQAPFPCAEIGSHIGSDQTDPSLTGNGDGFAMVWTDTGNGGTNADILGAQLNNGAQLMGRPFKVNTDETSMQYMATATLLPETGEILAVWSSFEGGPESFELTAQRFDGAGMGSGLQLPTPEAPFVFGLGFNSIGISWPAVEGMDLDHYEIFIDDSDEAIVSENNYIEINDLGVSSDHEVRLVYVSTGAAKSPVGPVGQGSTWDQDANNDGLPDTFQQTFWGHNQDLWEDSHVDSDNDGHSNLEELLVGTNPLNTRSVLKVELEKSEGSYWLRWDTHPGGIYQVQRTGDLEHWERATGPRFANSGAERLALDSVGAQQIYRIVRLK